MNLAFADEEIQSTCLRWIAEFLLFVQPTMVPFVPRLIPVILGSLAHHVSSIRTAANETNFNLYNVIQSLPPPTPLSNLPTLPSSTSINAAGKQPELSARDRTLTASPILSSIPFPTLGQTSTSASRIPTLDRLGPAAMPKSDSSPTFSTQFESLDVGGDGHSKASSSDVPVGEPDPFDYGATVNALTLQFLSEHEETRVAALGWLLMLHTKAPKKVRRSSEVFTSS